MTVPARIMVVDDDEKIIYAFREVLQRDGHVFLEARDGEEALRKLDSEKPDIIFMDITMPGLDGLQTLKKIKESNYTLPVIIITGQGTMQTAIRAMQLGAFQYLNKPLSVQTIRDEIAKAHISLKSAVFTQHRFVVSPTDRYQLIGNSIVMHEIYKLIGSVSTTSNHTSVLITGESGTGKELVARAIHTNSGFPGEPFVAINCTAVPETLLESELFGHEKGAFTGAIERKTGKFELAGQGTIFLDEIGDLSVNLQHKLLRVLQEREFERVGGNTTISVGARFIAATNQDVENRVKMGSFREDLLYRLKVITVKMPPLREHAEDIPLLASFFLQRHNARIKKTISGFSQEAMEKLQTYTYPGNVRELENIIERAVMLTTGSTILPQPLGELDSVKEPDNPLLPMVSPVYSQARDYLLETFEKQFITAQLKQYRGNVSEAARASRMSRQNFHRLMQKYKINPNE
jgi:two-component system response regulator AtoC